VKPGDSLIEAMQAAEKPSERLVLVNPQIGLNVAQARLAIELLAKPWKSR
jgi:hypothetical protein